MKLVDTGLDEKILKICEENNIIEATKIQEESIPLILSGHSILGASETGSGKTFAFLLPTLHKLLKADRSFFALIITPTRELALQIERCIMLFESLGVRCCTLIGGDKIEKHYTSLAKHPHFVIGTPGRIALVIKKSNKLKIKNFRMLIVDEVDKCFGTDLFEEIKLVIQSMRPKRQNLFFSATMSEEVKEFANTFFKNYKIIASGLPDNRLKTLDEYYFLVPRKFKEVFLLDLFKEKRDTKFIVFVKMISTARLLSCMFKHLGISNEALHGDLKQEDREKIFEGLRTNHYQVLFTTDVGSRGIDVQDIGYVINYDIPRTAHDYTHRVGRTARAGRNGVSITLVTQYDVPSYQYLEFKLKRQLQTYTSEYNPECNLQDVQNSRALAAKEVKNLAEKERTLKGKHRKQ